MIRTELTKRGPLFIALSAVCIIAFFKVLSFVVPHYNNDLDHQREFNEHYKVYSLNIPARLDLAGEHVPLSQLEVRERLDKELHVNTYWQSNSILMHKRASRWFPMMDKVFKRNDVPGDLKYLSLIESGLQNVVSPAGAAGPWQFMRTTALEYGLEVNDEVDERYHMEKSTEAASAYLKAAFQRYGSWTLAAASYNMGMSGLDQVLEAQKVKSYYDLSLNDETSRYVLRAVAFKEIFSDPKRYGFQIRDRDLYRPYDTRTVIIDGPIEDLAAFALRQGTDLKTLKLLNPWMRASKLTNRQGKLYAVLLPGQDFDRLTGE